jgi:hypothetical protein
VVNVTSDTAIGAGFALNNSLVVVPGGNGTGTVTSNVGGINCGATCSAAYSPGTPVTLTASAATGSTFTGWGGNGGCSGNQPTCMVTVNAALGVTATFTLQQFTLTVANASTGASYGTVTGPNGISCGNSCSAIFNYGTQVNLSESVSPNAAATFTGWSGACSGAGACAPTVTGPTSVTANYTLNHYTVAVTKTGTGAGYGTVSSLDQAINCGGTCTHDYDYNTQVTLNASVNPTAAATFTGWSGPCSGTGACVVNVTAAAGVTANFTLNPYTVTVTNSGTGAAYGVTRSLDTFINCPGTCSKVYDYGTQVTLQAAVNPPAAATFANWSGPGGCTTGNCVFTVTGDTPVTAVYNITPYTLTVTKNAVGSGAGTVTSSPAGISCGATCATAFNYNTPVTLTAVASPGSAFQGWSGGGCSGTGTCVVPMTATTGVTAQFTGVITATWDPSWGGPGITYSNGNLSISGDTSGATSNTRTVFGKSSGKWYWEVTATGGTSGSNGGGLGIAEAGSLNATDYLGEASAILHAYNEGFTFGYAGHAQYYGDWNTALTITTSPPASSYVNSGKIYMFALDMDAGKLWVGDTNTWYNSGDPGAGTTPAVSGLSGTAYPAVTQYNGTANAYTANFGASAFNYTVPAGFNAGFYNIPTTWDPTWSLANIVTYTNNNLSIAGSAATQDTLVRTVAGRTTGKYYFEINVTNGSAAGDTGGIGIIESAMPNAGDYIGGQASGIGWGYGSAGGYYEIWAGAVFPNPQSPGTAAATEIATGTTYMFALDMTNKEFWAGQGGTWYNAGNPAAGTSDTNQVATSLSGTVYPSVVFYASSPNRFTANFGASPFSFAVPSGFAAGLY